MSQAQEEKVARVTAEIMAEMDCFNPSKFEGKVREILTRELTVPEYITMAGGEELVCLCGNYPASSGFESCLPDGTPVEPLASGPWDGRLYRCGKCGRIIDQVTLEVKGSVQLGTV